MKYKINAGDYDDLDSDIQKLYSKKGDGYQLKVSGLPDADGLQTRVEQMDAKITELLDENKTMKRERDQQQTDKHKEDKDFDALEDSWKTKLATRESELSEQITSLTGHVEALTSGAEATKIASEISIQGSAPALLPHLKARLKTELVNGVPKTVVVDSQGKPSAMSVAELAEEFKSSSVFKPLIVGSKAGGAGHQKNEDGSGASGNAQMSRAEYDALPTADRSAFFRDGGLLVETS